MGRSSSAATGWQQGPNHNVTAGAIYNALALNAFLRNGDWVTLANMTALLHGGSIKKDHGVVYVDPQYYTSQLYAAAHPQTPDRDRLDGAGPRRAPARLPARRRERPRRGRLQRPAQPTQNAGRLRSSTAT